MSEPIRKCETIRIGQEKKMRDRPLITWDQVIRKNMRIRKVNVGIAIDRNEWLGKIRIKDPREFHVFVSYITNLN